MTDTITAYLDEVQREFASGIAAEHAYRPALERLLESPENGLNAINDPRRTNIGAPDFVLLRDRLPIGIVEAKDIGVGLDAVERSDQMQRYQAFGNVILTDYLEFRWYTDGEHRETVRIADHRAKKIKPLRDTFPALQSLLVRFVQARPPEVSDPADLAARLAALAREIKLLITSDLDQAQPEDRSEQLVSQKTAFEQTLLPGLTNAEFADMYAQTLTYGLFTARVNYRGARELFSRTGAASHIPRTNPFLRRLFHDLGFDAGQNVTWLIDRVAELLAQTDIDAVLEGFGRATRQEDPVVHFYETFLAAYDPQTREQRGVYYTPEPVVSYIVRSVDHLLRTRFDRFDGLADRDTLILDPATGTGTFLYFVIQQIRDALGADLGGWDAYVREGLLPRIFGFELLMAPYAVAHMKLGLLLQEFGYQFASDERLGVYLTNTLEESVKTAQIPFAGFIEDEAKAANQVKSEKPIMVVLGNPPYSGHSANTGKWIVELVRDYYFVDEQPLGERNPKYLQDDYVKFIRFGQWRIEQTGEGVLAFVTNHGYLDNPTFRGMRQQLMNAFSEIYILNLHGNSLKKETTPDGGTDQNVFDIRQGVAIGLFVKRRGVDGPAKVYYADLWGVRQAKYDALLAGDVQDTAWQEIKPDAPFYLFRPQDIDMRAEYRTYSALTDVFSVMTNGFKTHRDSFAIAFERDEMHQRIQEMRSHRLSNAEFRRKYGVKDNRDWQLSRARVQLHADEDWESNLIQCTYRPFDWRYCYFSEVVMDRPRRELIDHVAGRENLCLLASRQQGTLGYRHCWIAVKPANDCAVSNKTREANQVFPLYLYSDPSELFSASEWPAGKDGRRPNLSPAFIREMESALGLAFVPDGRGDLQATFGPEDVLHYIYAVFHCPTYRERYAEFLRIDFPRVPITGDPDFFAALCAQGAALVALHLLDRKNAPVLNERRVIYPVAGDHVVARGYPKFAEPDRVYINKTQYFEGVPAAVWEFRVGGYQVLHKWLKDRRGRVLSSEEQDHYKRVVVALAETQRIMAEIDALIPGWPLK